MVNAVRSFLIAAAALVILSPAAYAASNSVSITPPPIAAPTFEKDKTDAKARVTYFSVDGNDMDLKGGGADFVGRKAFTDSLAGDLQAGFFMMGGDVGTGASKTSLTMGNFLFGVNGEFLVYRGDTFSTLLFAGPNLTLIAGSFEYQTICGTQPCTDTATITGNLFGVQAGIQFGIKAGDIHIDPFAMVSNQSGSMTVSTSFADTTTTIDPYTTTSFGLDITYTPWNMSFSAILQEAAKQSSSDKEGVKMNIYQLSWHF